MMLYALALMLLCICRTLVLALMLLCNIVWFFDVLEPCVCIGNDVVCLSTDVVVHM